MAETMPELVTLTSAPIPLQVTPLRKDTHTHTHTFRWSRAKSCTRKWSHQLYAKLLCCRSLCPQFPIFSSCASY